MPEPLKAVGYCRVSTDTQAAEGVSLDMQHERIGAWCRAQNYELLAMYRDAGLSGTTAARPGLQAALDHACRDRAAFVVYSLSRASRSTRDMLAIAERLDRAASDLVSLSERIDTVGATGKMLFRLLAVLNEFERDQISERTTAALRHKQSRGEHVGRAARGLRILDGRLAADPASDGLRLVLRARELRDSGLTLDAVGRQLAADGFLPERGRRFWPSAVRLLLANTSRARIAVGG